MEVDDVNVTGSMAANGGFETGTSSWAIYPGTATNFQVYANAPGAPSAHGESHWGATNTTSNSGGIYQDIALNTSAGRWSRVGVGPQRGAGLRGLGYVCAVPAGEHRRRGGRRQLQRPAQRQ